MISAVCTIWRGVRFLLFAGLVGYSAPAAWADSITFSPAEGNALTHMTVTVEGFIGTNGPAYVSVGGGGFIGSCNSGRPCTFEANMGYYGGKHWVEASATVNGVNVVVSNYFTVRDARAYLNRACGANGTKVIVTGYDFARNSIVYVDGTQGQADVDGRFVIPITIPEGISGTFKIIAHDGTRFVTNEFSIDPNSTCEVELGHVRDIQGNPTVQRPGGQPQPLRPGDPIHFGDEVNTGAGGHAHIDFEDETALTLGENAKVRLDDYVFNPADAANNKSSFSILEGLFKYTSGLISSRPNPDVQMNTVYGAIGVRGTEFVSRRDPCSTTQEVYLIHGQLAIKPVHATVTNIVDAPATIFYDATNVWISGLTQEAYEAAQDQVNQTNSITFNSWQTQHFGCPNGNPLATADADPDGDGQNNHAEFLAHTDPNNSASVFRVVSATREGDDVRLTWKTHGGITNIVQAANNLGGNYTNISPALVMPGASDLTTNFLDAGALTNSAARYYRVRLGP